MLFIQQTQKWLDFIFKSINQKHNMFYVINIAFTEKVIIFKKKYFNV